MSNIIPHSQPWINDEDKSSVEELLSTAMLSKGKKMEKLEQELAAYLKKNHALFTGNGTQAQIMLMRALDIGKNDEVIMPTYVCNKVLKGIEAIGAKPVLCDINKNGVMDYYTIKEKVSPKTKAIILVHIFGINAWDDKLNEFNIPVIEDICQSFGSLHSNDRTGTYTDFAFTSFHGTKTLPLGEGGMLFVNDSKLFAKITENKNNLGYFVSGTDIIGALGLSMFSRYSTIMEKRAEIANKYSNAIAAELSKVEGKMGKNSMYFRYILHSNKNWDTIQKKYLEFGIHVRKGVDALVHRELEMADADFPNAHQYFQTAVSIPILPQLGETEIEHIISCTNILHREGVL